MLSKAENPYANQFYSMSFNKNEYDSLSANKADGTDVPSWQGRREQAEA